MLHFELVTPEKLVRSEDVYMVVVPGSEGEFGVLEGHAPIMSTIIGRVANRTRRPTRIAAPQPISKAASKYAVTVENGMSTLAKRPGPSASGRRNFRNPSPMKIRPT